MYCASITIYKETLTRKSGIRTSEKAQDTYLGNHHVGKANSLSKNQEHSAIVIFETLLRVRSKRT